MILRLIIYAKKHSESVKNQRVLKIKALHLVIHGKL